MPAVFTLARPSMSAALRSVGTQLLARGALAPPPAASPPAFDFIGGRNVPTVQDIGNPLPPGTDSGSTGAPEEEESPAPAPSWLSQHRDKLIIAGIVLMGVYTAYQHGKSKKTNRRRRNRRSYR